MMPGSRVPKTQTSHPEPTYQNGFSDLWNPHYLDSSGLQLFNRIRNSHLSIQVIGTDRFPYSSDSSLKIENQVDLSSKDLEIIEYNNDKFCCNSCEAIFYSEEDAFFHYQNNQHYGFSQIEQEIINRCISRIASDLVSLPLFKDSKIPICTVCLASFPCKIIAHMHSLENHNVEGYSYGVLLRTYKLKRRKTCYKCPCKKQFEDQRQLINHWKNSLNTCSPFPISKKHKNLDFSIVLRLDCCNNAVTFSVKYDKDYLVNIVNLFNENIQHYCSKPLEFTMFFISAKIATTYSIKIKKENFEEYYKDFCQIYHAYVS